MARQAPKPVNVIPLTLPPYAGMFAVEGLGARWGIEYTPQEAQELADRINRACRLPDDEEG